MPRGGLFFRWSLLCVRRGSSLVPLLLLLEMPLMRRCTVRVAAAAAAACTATDVAAATCTATCNSCVRVSHTQLRPPGALKSRHLVAWPNRGRNSPGRRPTTAALAPARRLFSVGRPGRLAPLREHNSTASNCAVPGVAGAAATNSRRAAKPRTGQKPKAFFGCCC